MAPEVSIVWVRSLLAVYRQALLDATRDDVSAEARLRLVEAVTQAQTLIARHETLESLWKALGGSEAGVRSAFAPLVAAARECRPDSSIGALVDFAAEEIAFLFDE